MGDRDKQGMCFACRQANDFIGFVAYESDGFDLGAWPSRDCVFAPEAAVGVPRPLAAARFWLPLTIMQARCRVPYGWLNF